MDKKHIKELITQYDHAYYNLDAPLVSDAEYDALKALLNEEETQVPGNALFNKVEHTVPMLSLDKVKITDQEELRKHIERLWPIVIQPKLDGLTLVIYPDGTCLTRGDGYIGENVTSNTCFEKGVLTDLPIRGEVVITKDNFERLNQIKIENGEKPFKNARNAAAGLLRQKENAEFLEYLTFISYELVGSTCDPYQQILTLNTAYQWDTVAFRIPKTIESALEYINTYDKESYRCDIDGLVIKHIGDKKFGTTSHHPNNAIGVKFVSDKKWTRLLNIVYSVGRTGKVIPVAEFEPIELMGSTVSKATLHNKAYIDALDLTTNPLRKEVCVTKANDIIPAIIGARTLPEYNMLRDIHYLSIPTHCPECGSLLEQINDQLFCRNEYCKEKIIAQAVHMASRQALDINGLSEETIRKMYDTFEKEGTEVNTYAFPLYFREEHLLALEGFAEKSAKKLSKEIQDKAFRPTMSRFLIACGIPLLGKTASKLIAQKFGTLDEIEKDLKKDAIILQEIEGVGDELIKNLKQYWWRVENLIDAVNGIKPEVNTASKNAEKQLTFVITGKFEYPRSHYEELITQAGHKLASSVSVKTDYLVIDNIDSTSTKAKKAKALNIKLINDEALLNLLKDQKITD